MKLIWSEQAVLDVEHIREVIYQGYRIVYRLRPDTIEIVTVVHGSRDLSNPAI